MINIETSPLVSVLATVYNREKYLAECLTSIRDSSFQDYEIVVIDDCSTDRSVEIAEEFAQRDKLIKKNWSTRRNSLRD